MTLFFFFFTPPHPPPPQFNFTLLSCAFIWRLHNAVLRRVSLCQAVQGCKGSSSRGMKWAQTSASKWFLSLGQPPPTPPPFPYKCLQPVAQRNQNRTGAGLSNTSAGSFHPASSQKLSHLSGHEGHPVPDPKFSLHDVIPPEKIITFHPCK